MKTISLILNFLLIFSTTVFATPVYKQTTKDGSIIFSSSPPSKNAKPAKLPEISRGEMKLKGAPLETCDRHGGINCAAGADIDGSVICFDSYPNASARFMFSCSSARLKIAKIDFNKKTQDLSVFVRNSKSVNARLPELYVKAKKGKDLLLSGPSEIEAYGVGEFVLDSELKASLHPSPRRQDFRLLCENCS